MPIITAFVRIVCVKQQYANRNWSPRRTRKGNVFKFCLVQSKQLIDQSQRSISLSTINSVLQYLDSMAICRLSAYNDKLMTANGP